MARVLGLVFLFGEVEPQIPRRDGQQPWPLEEPVEVDYGRAVLDTADLRLGDAGPVTHGLLRKGP
jgi:hypothetical protein